MQLTERRSEGLLRVYDVVVPASELQQKLNAKIAEQEAKVEKAKQVKDEAEKRQQGGSAPSSGY